MNPTSLKLLCFEHLFLGLECEISDCHSTPVAFLTSKGEKCLLCQKHFEHFNYYHDGFDLYYTHDNGGRPFKVHVGKATVYIYRNVPDCPLVKRYGNVEHVFIGTNLGTHFGNTILLKIEDHKYVYIGEWVVEFEIEDEIVEYHSYIGSNDVPYPVAVGKENVYFGPAHRYYPKSIFPEGINLATCSTCWFPPNKILIPELCKELKRVTVIHPRV